MDFLATAREITNWIIQEPGDIMMCIAKTAGVVAVGVGLGCGIKWFEKNANKPLRPPSLIKWFRHSGPESK